MSKPAAQARATENLAFDGSNSVSCLPPAGDQFERGP